MENTNIEDDNVEDDNVEESNSNDNQNINILLNNVNINSEDENMITNFLMELLQLSIRSDSEETIIGENENVEENSQEQSDINSSAIIRRSILNFNNHYNTRTINSRNSIINENINLTDNLINNRYNNSYNNSFTDDIILQSLYQKSQYKNVISDEGKNDLKIIKYHFDNAYNTACPISLVDFEENQELIALPCNHCFIPDVIKKWLEEEKAECPVCRFKLKNKEIKNNFIETTNSQTHFHDISQILQNSLISLFNTNIYNSIPINHPYGPRDEVYFIQNSYINDYSTNNYFTNEEIDDIETALLISLTNMYDISRNNL